MAFLRLTHLSSLMTFLVVWFWLGDARHEYAISDARPSSAAIMPCTVTSVWDGDGPIHCQEGGKIRLTAIAARELDNSCSPGHPCPAASGTQARDTLRGLALGQTLACEPTGKSYGRITAWCWRPDGVELNCAMLRSGTVAYWAKFDRAGRMCGGSL